MGFRECPHFQREKTLLHHGRVLAESRLFQVAAILRKFTRTAWSHGIYYHLRARRDYEPDQSCTVLPSCSLWVFHIDKDDWLAKDRNETWQEVSRFRTSMRSSRPQGEDLPLVLDTRCGPDWRGY